LEPEELVTGFGGRERLGGLERAPRRDRTPKVHVVLVGRVRSDLLRRCELCGQAVAQPFLPFDQEQVLRDDLRARGRAEACNLSPRRARRLGSVVLRSARLPHGHRHDRDDDEYENGGDRSDDQTLTVGRS
jgi:hypothetical protein